MRVNGVIRIAARHSDLARLQAYRVGDALKDKFPDLNVKYSFRASLGDVNLEDPLWKMPEKGVFTEDFVKDLVEGSADLVVHSWKDLPTIARPDTEVVATLPRADVRDLLLVRKDRLSHVRESGTLKVLTSSPRRAYNLEAFLKSHLPLKVREVRFETVRGNIPTRLKKLLAQDVDALVVAKAALDRLLEAPEPEFGEAQSVIRASLEATRFVVLPLSVNPTAAAQGALAIEISKRRPDLSEMLAAVHCNETFECVQEERKILASYGGGCHQKIGVNAMNRPYGRLLFLRGLTDAGETLETTAITSRPKLRKVKSESSIFPRPGEESAFFVRETLAPERWTDAKAGRLLWVARESAWPLELEAREDVIVWTAGLSTWRALASRGVWVSGSAEGLGEVEPTRIEAILSASSVKGDGTWLKLTHEAAALAPVGRPEGSPEGAPENAQRLRALATYRLVPKATPPDLHGRTHFYWMSGSSFDRALELYPSIRDGVHACGPGATFHHIKNRLGPSGQVEVFLNLAAFREALAP